MPSAACRDCGELFERPARGRPREACYSCRPRDRRAAGRLSDPVPAPVTATVAVSPEPVPARQPVLDPDEMTVDEIDTVIEVMEQQFPGPLGCTEPRLFTPPLRPLTPETTVGYLFVTFCHRVLGEPLLPWQVWLAVHALELAPGYTTNSPRWRFRFKVILVVVARQNGKSDFSRRLKLFRLFVTKAKLVIGTAQDLDVARSMLEKTNEMIDDCPALAEDKLSYITANGKERLTLTDGRAYVLKASNKKAGRGPSADHVDMDELREHRDWGAWGALSKTIRARPNGQIWGFSNAGDDQSVVLNKLQKNATSRIEGVLVEDDDDEDATQTFMAEWSAPKGCELTDVDATRQANPGLGYLFGIDSIWSDLENDPVEVFRTEVLCQRVEQLDGAIDLAAWKDCRDAAATLANYRDRLAVCLDVSPDGAHATLVAAAIRADGRTQIETLGAWGSTEAARKALPDILAKLRPRRRVLFPTGPAAVLRVDFAAGLEGADEVIELTGTAVTEACMAFAELTRAGRIVHPDDALIDAHVGAARKLRQGDGWRFVREGNGHVDAAYACAGAVQGARTMPEDEEIEPMMVAVW